MAKKITVIDYGLGNLFSVERAFRYIGADVTVTHDAGEIKKADYLVLPGVGAFGDGMAELKKRNTIEPLSDYLKTGRPFLGICLGMQLLMTESEEFGFHRGLDLVAGKVVRLKDGLHKIKIPHVGWNGLQSPRSRIGKGDGKCCERTSWEGLLGDDDKKRIFVYFVHSYMVIPDHLNDVLAETEYGENIFCSVLQKDNILACQFHPERSGEAGLRVLRQFLSA